MKSEYNRGIGDAVTTYSREINRLIERAEKAEADASHFCAQITGAEDRVKELEKELAKERDERIKWVEKAGRLRTVLEWYELVVSAYASGHTLDFREARERMREDGGKRARNALAGGQHAGEDCCKTCGGPIPVRETIRPPLEIDWEDGQESGCKWRFVDAAWETYCGMRVPARFTKADQLYTYCPYCGHLIEREQEKRCEKEEP